MTTPRLICALLALTTVVSAHFVFVVPQPGAAMAQVILSEDLNASEEVDAGLIGKAKLSLRGANGHETPLALVKAEHAYVTALPGDGQRLIHGVVDLGLMQHGPGRPYVLVYYPKTIVGDAFDPKAVVAGETPVEIVPEGKPGAMMLKLLAHGKPVSQAEVTVILPDKTQQKLTTDENGFTAALLPAGRYGAWARYWEPIGGERDGKSYAETRNYATLVFDVPPAGTGASAERFSTLPQATSSFGAVVSDGWLYVYGGHIAPTHSYSTESVSGQFARLKLSDIGGKWEQLPGGPGLQGMNLVAYKGMIYRVGGMSPRNKPSEAAATYSVAECARFHTDTLRWEPLPPLPEARSSHDVVVIGGKLIVVGGWTLNGPLRTAWLDTMEVLNLDAAKLEWKPEPQPFHRRALIASAYGGKMYVLGGFDDLSKVSREVSIYDPGTHTWSTGPGLPGTDIDSFAPAACTHGDSLYVSIADGSLYRLDETRQVWERAGNTTPRVAHRMASNGNTILVMGGAAKGRNSDLVEAVAVEANREQRSKR